jgi:hypothetical protein
MDINQQLFRNIKSGSQYDNLIPKTTCQPTQVGKGMTDFSVDKMVEVVKKYGFQAKKVAEKLQSSSLEKTCENFHQFIYWHFAYKADVDDQLLRSFACSWFDRKNGIDCKSYSIAASSLLSSLGIKHYIRKIKQPGYAPTEWTHVYVVVPKDQKTGSLYTQGYYTIDGTLAEFDREPKYNLKKDKEMMNHVMLNGVASLRAAENNSKNSEWKKLLTKDNLKKVGNFWNQIKGFFAGDAWYKSGDADKVDGEIFDHFDRKVQKINAAKNNKPIKMGVFNQSKIPDLKTEVYAFLCHCKMIADTYQAKRNHGWSNQTNKNLERTIYTASFYKDAVYKALEAWVNDNYTKGSIVGQQSCSMQNWEIASTKTWWGSAMNPLVIITEGPIYSLFPKKPINQIPDFQINEYLRQQYQAKGVNNNPTNIAGYIALINETVQGVQNTVGTIKNTIDPILGNGGSATLPNTGGYVTADVEQTKNAGVSTILTIATVGVLGTIAYNYFTKKS